jgi:hypothetical protein
MRYDGYGRFGRSGARVAGDGIRRRPGRGGRSDRRSAEPVTPRRTGRKTR